MGMLELFNTMNRKKEAFTPLTPTAVSLYTCGPTVYNYAHIGNLRTYIFEDILKRVLKYNGYQVNHVMNITDVGHLTDDADSGEDKMVQGSLPSFHLSWVKTKSATVA
jgi:cysteinyl-tRNA synthetase